MAGKAYEGSPRSQAFTGGQEATRSLAGNAATRWLRVALLLVIIAVGILILIFFKP